jgi:hypothetical protein
MPTPDEQKRTDWTEVIAKCLCYVSLQQSEKKNASMLERARFLEGLGLSRVDRAAVLGTTSRSLSELERQSRQRKTLKRANKTQSRRR